MHRKITAQDVALHCRVSVSAVSRAFQSGGSLSPEKRRLILRVAHDMGYATPSGQSVAALTQGTITLVAGDMANPFYPTVVESFAAAIHARGQRLIVHGVPPGGTVDMVMHQVLEYRGEAAIVTSATLSSNLARACHSRQMPVVLFNRVQSDARIAAVTCDNYGGGQQVAAHLLREGRQRIAVIGGLANTSTHLERLAGFREVLTAAGVALLTEAPGQFTYAGGHAAARQLFPARPDAIFCLNDVMALGAIDAARAQGLRLPQDLAIIGFDDIPMAGWDSFQLSTVRQPIARMVTEALALIDAQCDISVHRLRVAPVDLVLRQSG